MTDTRCEYRHGVSPDALRDLPDGCAAAVVTDPPYGLAEEYGRRRDGCRTRWNIANDSDHSALARTLDLMRCKLDRFGVMLVFAAPTERASVEALINDCGLRVDGFAPWDKQRPGISYGIRYAYEECIIASHNGTDSPFDFRESLVVPIRDGSLWTGGAKILEHPNQKPIPLLRRLIQWACPQGGLVVDPFAGIASCGVAALAERCSYIGVECDERWWPIAERRLAEAQDRPHPLLPPTLFDSVA